MLQSWGRPLGSWASFIAQSVKNLPAMQETPVRFLGREDPLVKEMASIPVFLPGKSHGQRSLAVHGVARVGHDLRTKPPPLGLIENGETGVQRRKKLASRSHSSPLLVWLCPVATIRIKGRYTPSVRLTPLMGNDHRAHHSRIPCYC